MLDSASIDPALTAQLIYAGDVHLLQRLEARELRALQSLLEVSQHWPRQLQTS